MMLKEIFEQIYELEQRKKELSSRISELWKFLSESGYNAKAAREAYRRLYKINKNTKDLCDQYEFEFVNSVNTVKKTPDRQKELVDV